MCSRQSARAQGGGWQGPGHLYKAGRAREPHLLDQSSEEPARPPGEQAHSTVSRRPYPSASPLRASPRSGAGQASHRAGKAQRGEASAPSCSPEQHRWATAALQGPAPGLHPVPCLPCPGCWGLTDTLTCAGAQFSVQVSQASTRFLKGFMTPQKGRRATSFCASRCPFRRPSSPGGNLPGPKSCPRYFLERRLLWEAPPHPGPMQGLLRRR